MHEHNEQARSEQIVVALQAGGTAALISDAGTPLISDPGYRLVALCHSVGVRVSPVPGPSALTAALSVSGLPTSSILFVGFPPAKSSARTELFKSLAKERHTLAFYESRHRIVASLQDMVKVFGGSRTATLAREITKTFETVRRASLAELLEFVAAASEQQKGEFVLLVAANDVTDETLVDAEITRVLNLLLDDVSVKRSAEIAAELTGCKRKHAYTIALALRNKRAAPQ